MPMHDSSDAPALLLVNLGTPAAPTAAAVRRYLAQFLHDHRVVQLTRWLWARRCCDLTHLLQSLRRTTRNRSIEGDRHDGQVF